MAFPDILDQLNIIAHEVAAYGRRTVDRRRGEGGERQGVLRAVEHT